MTNCSQHEDMVKNLEAIRDSQTRIEKALIGNVEERTSGLIDDVRILKTAYATAKYVVMTFVTSAIGLVVALWSEDK